jgi:GNAT superfamily N-acetyltransferase
MTYASELVTIRPASRHDMAAVAVMAGEFHAFLSSIDASDPTFDIESATLKLARSGFGSRPLFSSLIAETDCEAVGYAIYNIGFWADSLQGMVLLTDLFVREAWRGRGVGGQLMDQLAVIGKDAGCEIVMWTVWSKNEAARRFYERLGAVPIDDEQLMKLSI